jgi:hypothetical protein
MYKSAYKLRLFLIASLIVLSTVTAAIPMGNINLFQNAMASEKHSDKNDNSQEYEKSYYSDEENNYRANYDDNYYYQDQQKQQPSYSNSYGYEDNKKISYGNSYDNDNSKYSNYPTKDKKYVCQTGQFEGFFVESVEFCLSHYKPPVPPTPINNNSSLVNTFTCVNPNVININTDTNQSLSSLNGLLQPIQGAAAKVLNGNLDGLGQIDLNKAIVNLCIINDHDNIVIGDGDGDGNGVGTDQCSEDVEACFQQFLSQTQFEQLSDALDSLTGVSVDIRGEEVILIRSFEDICSALEGLPFEQLQEGVIELLPQIFDPQPPPSITRLLLNCLVEAINRSDQT